MSDPISRQAAIDNLTEENIIAHLDSVYDSELRRFKRATQRIIAQLPSAQPDGIPLEWIDKHLEWLDNCDNDFAQLAKVGIRAMVEIWKKDKI